MIKSQPRHKINGGRESAMLQVRQISDDLIEQQIGGAPLGAMDSLYIDDVLSIVDRGLENLPSYLDLYRKAVKQAWSPDELDFSRDKQEWEFLSPEAKRRRIWSMRMFFDGEERVAGLLAPFVWAAPDKEVEAFAATQLADEVRPTIFFDRYWREVVGTSAANLDELVEEIGIKPRSEEHTSELQSLAYLVCRLLLEKKKKKHN